jgi:hypothetical protein
MMALLLVSAAGPCCPAWASDRLLPGSYPPTQATAAGCDGSGACETTYHSICPMGLCHQSSSIFVLFCKESQKPWPKGHKSSFVENCKLLNLSSKSETVKRSTAGSRCCISLPVGPQLAVAQAKCGLVWSGRPSIVVGQSMSTGCQALIGGASTASAATKQCPTVSRKGRISFGPTSSAQVQMGHCHHWWLPQGAP